MPRETKPKIGRPRTSPGWATVSVRLPIPTVEQYRALPLEARSWVQGRLREAVEAALAQHGKGGR